MAIRSVSTLLLAVIAASAAAADRPTLGDLRAAIEPAVKERYPDAVFEQSDKELRVSANTMPFWIHTVYKDGKIAEKPRQVTGPKHDGFILRVTVSNEYHALPVPVPSTRRGPYWTGFGNHLPNDGSTPFLNIAYEYGSRVDREVDACIREAIGANESSRSRDPDLPRKGKPAGGS